MPFLMLKDLQLAQKTLLRNAAITGTVMIILALSEELNCFFVYYFMAFLFISFEVVIFSVEEKEHTLNWIRSLPILPKDIVISRYLSMGLTIFLVSIVTCLLQVFVSIGLMDVVPSPGQFLLPIGLMSGFLATFAAVTTPLFYRFGYTEGNNYMRMVMMAMVLIPIGIKVALENFADVTSLDQVFSALPTWLMQMPISFWTLLLCVFAAVIYVISMQLSLRFFNSHTIHQQ